MIFALAGRRIDPENAVCVRFPLRNAELVRDRLLMLFEKDPMGTLVCSAACGADLLALDAAGGLGWRRRVMLPFDPVRFRETSVTDRPGDWGALYDRVLQEVAGQGDLLIESAPQGAETYGFVNDRILTEASRLAAGFGGSPVAVVVWDGASYGAGDQTGAFAAAALKRGLTVLQVSTRE